MFSVPDIFLVSSLLQRQDRVKEVMVGPEGSDASNDEILEVSKIYKFLLLFFFNNGGEGIFIRGHIPFLPLPHCISV